jgi:hypothetical protein
LFFLIGAHVTAAITHTFIFRDRILQRMLPEIPIAMRARKLRPRVVVIGPSRERA